MSLTSVVRIGAIYILSAFLGSLVAALFVQNSPQVCSSGGLFGLLGSMLSGLIRHWKLYTKKVIISFTIRISIHALFLKSSKY